MKSSVLTKSVWFSNRAKPSLFSLPYSGADDGEQQDDCCVLGDEDVPSWFAIYPGEAKQQICYMILHISRVQFPVVRQSICWQTTGEGGGEYTIQIQRDGVEFIVLSLLTLVFIASAEGREFTVKTQKNNSLWKVLLQEIWPQFNSE